jgi:hypothetical protein
MSKTLPHNRLIAQAAKEVLAPLGLGRQGRSRTWLDDHSWWLGVVEFQPSDWSRGTYLNVGAMWLWHRDKDYVYFDLSHRVDGGLLRYDNDEQFLPEIRQLALRAAAEVERLRGRIRTFEDVARELTPSAVAHGGWAAWDAAMALGLAGETEAAAAMFARVIATDDDRDWWLAAKREAAELQKLLKSDVKAFRAEVNGWIADYREALRLPPLT